MRHCGYLLAALLLAGCTVGPNYKRPAVPIPPSYRGEASPAATSLADAKWSELFQDDTMKQLIGEALEHNLDLAAAAERVQQARAVFRISWAEQFPFLYAQASATASRPSLNGSNRVTPGTSLDAAYTQAGLALTWEVDLWGRIRRLTQSAAAQYLATEEARRGIIVSLVADVAGTYFTLRERDLELEIARSTRDLAARNLELVSVRHDHGAVTALDVRQAEEFLHFAGAQIAATQRDIGLAENALSMLLGRTPGEVARGQAVGNRGLPPDIPAGLPSSLLERRPDIREAEQRLIAANAQIGAAKAYYFPQISLTGFLGGQSRALSELFTGPARDWFLTPAASMPLFNAGQVRVAVRLTEAQKREMVVAYQRAILNGFREVSDALIGYRHTREQTAEQTQVVTALEESNRLANLRYRGGMDSYLQVLDADRTLFQGRLTLAQLRLQQQLSYVYLYRALGGGW